MFAGLSLDLLKKLLEASVAEHNSLARCVCVWVGGIHVREYVCCVLPQWSRSD